MLPALLPLLPQDRNEITDIAPLNYGGLARLETLSLSGNRLTELPEQARPVETSAACAAAPQDACISSRRLQIGELKALAVLNVADNAITELPAGLAGLTVKKVGALARHGGRDAGPDPPVCPSHRCASCGCSPTPLLTRRCSRSSTRIAPRRSSRSSSSCSRQARGAEARRAGVGDCVAARPSAD